MREKKKPFEWKIHQRSPDRWDGKAWPENIFRVVVFLVLVTTKRKRAKVGPFSRLADVSAGGHAAAAIFEFVSQ